jgi:signal transduction histidine kinase
VTLVFTAVMAVVLAATGVFLYERLRVDLDDAINKDLHSRAAALASAIRVNDVGLGESARSILRDPRQGFTQVLTPAARLFDPSVQHGTPVLDPATAREAAGGPMFLSRSSLPGLGGEPARLLARPIVFERHPVVVVVGASLADRDHALESLQELLLIGGPVALLLAALAAYGTVAAALRPVEAMRIRATEISDAPGGSRLPVPPADDELHRLGETLNEMLDRLEESIERERSFVDDASHELRTPLALHRTELELALRYGGTTDELKTSIAAALGEANRLSQLAEDLLVIARADKGGLPIEAHPLEVGLVFDSVRERFSGRVEDAGRSLAVDHPAGLLVQGDRTRLEQALGNLVENALSHGGGAVEISARTSDGSVQLHVTDSGAGFPPEFLPHAFERFGRADLARGEGGAGLGLAIVEAIASAHGGRAGAANLPAGGADVWIELKRP